MNFLATLPAMDSWLEINAEVTAEAMVAFIRIQQGKDIWEQSITEFKKATKKMSAESLLNLLRHLSTEDTNIRLLLIPLVIIIEDEITRRCLFFEQAHPIPPS